MDFVKNLMDILKNFKDQLIAFGFGLIVAIALTWFAFDRIHLAEKEAWNSEKNALNAIINGKDESIKNLRQDNSDLKQSSKSAELTKQVQQAQQSSVNLKLYQEQQKVNYIKQLDEEIRSDEIALISCKNYGDGDGTQLNSCARITDKINKSRETRAKLMQQSE